MHFSVISTVLEKYRELNNLKNLAEAICGRKHYVCIISMTEVLRDHQPAQNCLFFIHYLNIIALEQRSKAKICFKFNFFRK